MLPAGDAKGHYLRNDSVERRVFVAGPHQGGGYSDIDMIFTADDRYCNKDGQD